MIRILLIAIIITLANVIGFAQPMQVGIIDYYGGRSTKMNLTSCLTFTRNDTLKFLTDSITYHTAKKKIVDCLLAQPNVKQADVSFVCCDAVEGKWMAFVGTSDLSKPVIKSNKTANIKLPVEIVQAYDSLMNLIMEAIQSGQGSENDSEGHAFLDYQPARKIQQRFITYAVQHTNILSQVIRGSKYPHQREVAATVIAYHPDKKVIIADLLAGVEDDNGGVRNDAIRALGIIMEYAGKHPELKIKISPDPFIKLMNSISWTDWNKSGFILLSLTADRDKKILGQLKKDALASLTDMARWKSEGHSLPGFMMLGRIAGWSEQEIFESSKKDREETLNKMLAIIK
jgi:hypothetical protein